MLKVLHITLGLGTVTADFKLERREWKCVRSDPEINWMHGASPGFIKIWLQRNGHAYEWRESTPSK